MGSAHVLGRLTSQLTELNTVKLTYSNTIGTEVRVYVCAHVLPAKPLGLGNQVWYPSVRQEEQVFYFINMAIVKTPSSLENVYFSYLHSS